MLRKFRSLRFWLLLAVLGYAVVGTAVRLLLPPPVSVALAGPARQADNLSFFHDDSWIDAQGNRQLQQSVFDKKFELINNAQQFVLLDMFLFNAWQGPLPELHRALSQELTQTLISRKQAVPDIEVIVISDPINTVYGSLQSPHFQALGSAGITVVQTRLEALQDSNPLWSGLWRIFMAPWGNASGTILPNPFGDGRVSLRSYLALLNFKANHRKLLVADDGRGALVGMVSSANPHDGSSAHRNVALQFSGAGAEDLLAGELALLQMNEASDAIAALDRPLSELGLETIGDENAIAKRFTVDNPVAAESQQGTQLQIISESAIHDTVLRLLNQAGSGDVVEMVMFYLSDRKIVAALIDAQRRGAEVRVLLDVNNDAFGRQKNGVPNRPVAAELVAGGVSVRWCATSGEQCHAKWLHVKQDQMHAYVLGSANFTRRNLHDFNLETNVLVKSAEPDTLTSQMNEFFEKQWSNTRGRAYSVPYEEFSDNSVLLRWQYRFMEATGLSTF